MATPLRFNRSLLTLGLAAALATTAAGQVAEPTGGIVGRIINQQSRQPVGGAHIALLGTARKSNTDTAGRFTQASLASGTYLLEVRAIGYGVTSWRIQLADGEVLDYVFELAPLGYDLDPVVVETAPVARDRRLAEFERRRLARGGIFITEEQIQRSNPATLTDLLRDVPGLRLICRGSSSCAIRMTRGARGAGCVPDWVVDGLHATNSTSLSMPAVGIVGVEIYRTVSETPMQFLRTNNLCGTIVIWTKSGL
jgi:hypothetical protein